jgi:YVTN family beta-propeller protein
VREGWDELPDAASDEGLGLEIAQVGSDLVAPVVGRSAAGFRTFLLSDIRGYSSFSSTRGDEAAASLADRFALLAQSVVSRFGGVNIGNRGDEVLIAFESPRQAVRAAVAFQQALLEATCDDPTLPLPAGVGLDIGEAVIVSDGWRANAINVAARLCSIAKGGEILATREVTHLAQAIDGVRYVPQPPVRLKGIPEPVAPMRIVADAGDTARGFVELGLTHAASSPVHRPKRRILGVAAIALFLGATAALVGLLTGGGGSTVQLRPGEIGAIATGSGDVTLAVPLNAPPTRVAVGRDGDIWVTSTEAGTVSRIDPRTHDVTQIPAGSDPAAVTVAPDGSVWVANSGAGTVSRISPQNNAVVATVPVGAGPSALAATSSAVWVANTLNGSVWKIDASGDRVVAKIPVGSEPAGLAAGDGSIWVANQGDGTVYRLDQGTGTPVAAPIAVGSGPLNVAFGEGAAWVANSIDGTLSRIDARSNSVTTIPVGQGPFDVAVGSGRVWVSDEYSNEVVAVDPATLTVTRRTGTNSAPLGLAIAGNRLVVATDGIGAAAHRGGVVYVLAQALNGFGGDPIAIDPGSAYTKGIFRVLVMTSDGLVGYRKTGGVAGSALVPDLAVSRPAPIDHGLTYTFRIRSGIRYSNGVLMRASDFRRGLERAFKVGGGPVLYFASLIGGRRCLQRPQQCDLSGGVVADDAANTVTFHLARPDPDLLNQLTLPAAYPVPPGTPIHLRRGGSIPGTGPYEVSSFAPIASSNAHAHGLLVLRRNPYFREWSAAAQPTGFPDKIVIRSNYPADEEASAIEQGRADITWDSPPADVLARLRQSFPAQLHESPFAETNYLWLNERTAPFTNVLARRAVNYALDRNMLATMTQGAPPGRPTCQLLPPDFPGYVPYCPYTVSPSSSGRWLAPDVSRAQTLVRESGTVGARVTFLISSSLDRTQPQAVVSALNAIGYHAQLKIVSPQVYYGSDPARLFSGVQAGTTGWIEDYVAPSQFLLPLVKCGGPLWANSGRFCDPGLDARMNKALTDQSVQAGMASQEWAAVDRSVVDAAVDVPISNSLEDDFVSRRVGNYMYNPQWGVLVDQLWVR